MHNVLHDQCVSIHHDMEYCKLLHVDLFVPSTVIAKTIKAEFNKMLMTKCHCCNFNRFTKSVHEVTKCSGHLLKVTPTYTARCIQNEQDIACIIMTVFIVRSVPCTMPHKIKWYWSRIDRRGFRLG